MFNGLVTTPSGSIDSHQFPCRGLIISRLGHKKMIEKFLSPNLMIKLGTDNHIYENLESGLTFINIDAPTVGTIQTRTCYVTKPII
jgi:hypothetical protein